MSESCQKGLNELFELQKAEQEAIESALFAKVKSSTIQQIGVEPITRPYLLRSDGMVTCFLLFCFIVLSYVLSRTKNYLIQGVKSFFDSKNRVGLFDIFTASDARYRLALLFQSCVLLGFCLYELLLNHNYLVFSIYPHPWLLALFIGAFILFFFAKYLLFQLINSVFFEKTKQILWIDSYFNVLVSIGFLLFPIILLVVYFDLSDTHTIYLSLIVIFISKTLLFYKCNSTFFNKIHRYLHLILYFCALEIVPDLLFWKGIVLMNTSLVLNF
ncbi:MAG: DUF4271 domain-containing protein [Phocaeicola sp.]